MALNETELIVAGGGMAGMTAALVAARNGLAPMVLTGGLGQGGHLLNIAKVEDFPGFPEGTPGYELCPALEEQAATAGAEFQTAALEGLRPSDAGWQIQTSEGDYRAEAVILATGSEIRMLGVPGEDRLRGKGVSSCAACDGPLFQGKTVAVVGDGDSALLEALELVEFVGRIVVFARDATLSGQHVYRERVLAHPMIDVRYETSVEEILGEDRVAAVRIRNGQGEPGEENVDAVFAYPGLVPNTAFLEGLLPLDKDGRVGTDVMLRTDRRGLFAAGDIRSDSVRQAIAAAGDGATAAIAAKQFLESNSWPTDDADRAKSQPACHHDGEVVTS